MVPFKIIFFIATFLITSFNSQAQISKDSVVENPVINAIINHNNLYDYSQMGDTIIRDYGNGNHWGDFYKSDGQESICCFASREILVQNGKLKQVVIYDANSGYETTYRYNKKGKYKVKRNYKQALNAPPFY